MCRSAQLPAATVLVLAELPPPAPDAPATGLGVPHARMAEALAARGLPTPKRNKR